MFLRTKKCSIAITPFGLIAIFPSGEKVRAEIILSKSTNPYFVLCCNYHVKDNPDDHNQFHY